jgi:hypothetical protein
VTPDWATISALATAGGTLVLAIATFASVRSANHAARTAEHSLQVGLRPVLFASRVEDRAEKIMWGDEHWATVRGGGAVVESVDDVIYLAMSLRNVGAGIAVLHGWHVAVQWVDATVPHAAPDEFRMLIRDLYIPANDIGLWQGAVRDAGDDARPGLVEVMTARRRFSIDLLYSDHDGGQRTVSRFGVIPVGDTDWRCSVSKHWNLDRQDPR